MGFDYPDRSTIMLDVDSSTTKKVELQLGSSGTLVPVMPGHLIERIGGYDYCMANNNSNPLVMFAYENTYKGLTIDDPYDVLKTRVMGIIPRRGDVISAWLDPSSPTVLVGWPLYATPGGDGTLYVTNFQAGISPMGYSLEDMNSPTVQTRIKIQIA